MNILVGFEESGVVRDAFLAQGHDAMSCDLQETATPGPHYRGDFFEAVSLRNWDFIIAHPPCTYVAVSGNRWYAGTEKRRQAIEFIEQVWNTPVNKMCLENPVSVLTTQSSLPSPQYIQPWQFGHGETKKTALFLRGLPLLQPTEIVEEREQRIWQMPPSEDRKKLRSRTYPGIAQAMAEQWA